jgi:hypothetical protein
MFCKEQIATRETAMVTIGERNLEFGERMSLRYRVERNSLS